MWNFHLAKHKKFTFLWNVYVLGVPIALSAIFLLSIALILSIWMLSLPTPEEICNQTTIEELNNYYGVEHIIRTEVFWSPTYNVCMVVSRRPFLEPSSDWAIEYFGNHDEDSYFLEAENFTLNVIENDGDFSLPYLEQMYFYSDLNEYLDNPKKYIDWELDFLKKIEHYR